MRITKLLSVFLAALMLFSCVAGALATGVAAEELGEGEETVFTPHYTDPREGVDESLIYTIETGVTYEGSLPSGVTFTKSSSFQGFAPLAKGTWPNGSVLVIKASVNLYMAPDSTNSSLPRYLGLFGGWQTMFREDGTKLPIVIEGTKADKGTIINLNTKSGHTNWQFTNDMYFSNVTFKAYSLTSAINICAGSGLVTFHDCTIEYSEYLNFYGDTFNADAWIGWNDSNNSHRDANTNPESGLIETGFIFGKGTSFINAEGTATTVPQIAATNNIGNYSNYKACEDNAKLAVGTELSDDLLTSYQTGVNGTRFFYGSANQGAKDYNSARYMPRPFNVKVNIVIDNGSTDGTMDFANIADRLGTQPVGASEVSIYSGDVLSYKADKGTEQYGSGDLKSTNREFYNGDITLNIGANVGTVTGLYDATLVGDFTLNITAGTIGTINAAGSASTKTLITGSYEANISGGDITMYRGSIATYGEGTNTNNVTGGNFGTFFGTRFGVNSVENNISGGVFDAFYGASNGVAAAYVGNSIVNNISGHYNDVQFNDTFHAGNFKDGSTAELWTSITTNVAGGYFHKGIDKGNATTATLKLTGSEETDFVRFLQNTVEFDSCDKTAGAISIYKSTITINDIADGSAMRFHNTSAWSATDAYSITLVGAASKNVTITTSQSSDTNSDGSDNTCGGTVVDGDNILVTYIAPVATTVAPTSATLIMDKNDTAVGIRFFFDKDEVDALEGFTYDILLNGQSIAGDMEEVEGEYTVATYAIGYADFNTALTFGGSVATDDTYSLASIAGLAADQWGAGAWLTWAKALVNLCGDKEIGEADLTKTYDEVTMDKGGLAADIADVRADFTMSNVTGVRFTVIFNTMPTDLEVTINGMDKTDIAVVDGNTVTIDLAFAAQNMEKNIAVKVKNADADYYFDWRGSVAALAQTVANDTTNPANAEAGAFLWYIQAAAAVEATFAV